MCVYFYFLDFVYATVYGDANFTMNVTSLTVGGFNQPAIARSLIELTGKAESGFCQRFLWLFPKPAYGKFSSYESIDENFIEKIGMSIKDHNSAMLIYNYISLVTVDLLASQWRRAMPGQRIEVTDYVFPTEPHQLQPFIKKHDEVTDQLEILAAKDDLLTGNQMYMYVHVFNHTARLNIHVHVKDLCLTVCCRCTKQVYGTNFASISCPAHFVSFGQGIMRRCSDF